jgi:ABC-type Na+ efflux pump permease subunit
MITAGLLAGSAILHNHVRFIDNNLILVTNHPFFLPIFLHMVLLSTYLSVISSIQVSRERDQGTYEVLLYGPVDHATFILGNFVGYLKVYLLSLVAVLIWVFFAAAILNLIHEVDVLMISIASAIASSSMVAFGLLIAAIGNKTRTSLTYFIIIIVVLAGMYIADQTIGNMLSASNAMITDPLLLIRTILSYLNRILGWISPYAQMRVIVDTFSSGALAEAMIRSVWALFESGILVTCSIAILHRKGARA